MSKIVIMTTAMIAAFLSGQPLMAAVFGSIMVTGLLVGCFLGESARRLIECPVSAFHRDRSRSRAYPGTPGN